MWTPRSRRHPCALAAGALSLALLLAACSTDVDGPGGEASVCDPATDAVFRAWERAGFDGSIAIIGPDLTCVGAYGVADPATGRANTPDTVFSIGSITKAVTAAAITDLVADGALTLETTAGEVLSGLDGPVADATIDQLLLHTSGIDGAIGRDDDTITAAEAIDRLGGLDRLTDAGTEFNYSNAGYVTLALVVDELTDGYRNHVVAEVLRSADDEPVGAFWYGDPAPEGPRAVGEQDDGEPGHAGGGSSDRWVLDGAGGVAMTPADLARWTRDLMTGALPDLDVDEARLAGLVFDRGDGTVEAPGWVFIPEAFGERLWGTSGGGGGVGHEMTVGWLPERRLAIAIASNSGDVRADTLLQAILPAIVADEPLPRPATSETAPDRADIEALAGRWELDGLGGFEVVDDGDAVLVAAADPATFALLFPIPDPDEAADHEARTLEVVDGGTTEGAAERARLEADFGPIAGIEVLGTAWIDIEYRTYLSVAFEGGDEVPIWLALDETGSIAAAELGSTSPTLRHVAADDGGFAPLDPAAADAGLGLRLVEGGLEVAHPGGRSVATRSE